MATFQDLLSNSDFSKISKIKDTIVDKEEKERKEREEKRLKSHIFKTYPDAMNYLVNNDVSMIWHGKHVHYDKERGCIVSYEQESDRDGINFWNVVKHYKPGELIALTDKCMRDWIEKFGMKEFKDYWYESNGMLQGVYILENN